MIGDEWLNLQDIFVLVVGQWIVAYLGVSLAGAICATFVSLLWRRPQRVQIVSREDDE